MCSVEMKEVAAFVAKHLELDTPTSSDSSTAAAAERRPAASKESVEKASSKEEGEAETADESV